MQGLGIFRNSRGIEYFPSKPTLEYLTTVPPRTNQSIHEGFMDVIRSLSRMHDARHPFLAWSQKVLPRHLVDVTGERSNAGTKILGNLRSTPPNPRHVSVPPNRDLFSSPPS